MDKIKKISIILGLLSKRACAALNKGAGIVEKIKGVYGLTFISKLRAFSFVMKAYNKKAQIFFTSGSDVAMWMEIFIDKEYELPSTMFPKTIIDIGANVGFSSLNFILRDPNTHIVALEPDPHNFSVLRKNVGYISAVTLLQKAIAAQSGERMFYTMPHQGMSSSFIKQDKAEAITVPTISLDEVLDNSGWQQVDLVKFDIEGAEWEVFKNAPLERIKALIGEYHEDLVGKPLNDFIALFPGFTAEVKELLPKRYIVYLH